LRKRLTAAVNGEAARYFAWFFLACSLPLLPPKQGHAQFSLGSARRNPQLRHPALQSTPM